MRRTTIVVSTWIVSLAIADGEAAGRRAEIEAFDVLGRARP